MILSVDSKTAGVIWPLKGGHNSAFIVPERSPSRKLAVQGAEALTDGTVGDSDGNLGTDDDSLHTTHIQVPPMLAAKSKKT
jgi:hypothetical protein